MKRPNKIKLEVVKAPSDLHFSDSLGKRGISIYVEKLSEALNSGGVVQIAKDDTYMRTQLKNSAKKLGLRLVYALAEDFVYVKPIAVDGDRKRLLLLLREKRTLNELRAATLQLDLNSTLAEFRKQGIAHVVQTKNGVDTWVLTDWVRPEEGTGVL